jgi:hypothetical protein
MARFCDRLGARRFRLVTRPHRLGNRGRGFAIYSGGIGPNGLAVQALADQLRRLLIDRTGVGLFLGNAQLRQHLDDLMRRNFKLPRQFVDADFAHSLNNSTLVDSGL